MGKNPKNWARKMGRITPPHFFMFLWVVLTLNLDFDVDTGRQLDALQ
jgi:hypothetical protein